MSRLGPPRTTIPGLMVLVLAVLVIPVCSAQELRGIWVDAFGPGFFNAQQVKKLAEDCRKYKFNAVFVEMRRRGDAFYHPQAPNEDPRTTIITTNFDALAEIIKECHEGSPRIQVHCWAVSHFIWAWDKPPAQPNHIFNRHPEYLTQDSIGQKRLAKGWYLDPGHPDANLTVLNMAKDIVSRYEIDGFHWDYCRYPVRDSGYNPTALARYNAEFGLTGAPAPDDPRFSDWRRRQVSDFLRWANAELWEIKPGLVISTAVFANLHDSRDYRFADWPQWCREGIVDVCVPMNFTPEPATFAQRAKAAAQSVNPERVWMGVGAYMNSPEATLGQVKSARDFAGAVLYSYRTPAAGAASGQAAFEMLGTNGWSTWTNVPDLAWKKTSGCIIGRVLDGVRGKPLYNIGVGLSGAVERNVVTEPHGAYAFFDLPPGENKLRVQIEGKEHFRDAVAEPGKVRRIDFD